MKFSENSPNIPDRLIWERDEGRVVFICGAGVSAEGAGLPNFGKLASKVMKRLRVPKGIKKKEILGSSKRRRGTVEVDKIFRKLEQLYPISDIERAVCETLSCSSDTLDSHQIIYDLSTTPHGQMRLVTTNFDDLFSRASGREGQIYPNFPDLEKNKDLDDLFYLHGKCGAVKKDRESSLVLSTRSFGQAYMSEGWAAKFIKGILKNYTVVFIGYSADDPPVQYLLEALSDSQMSRKRKRKTVYAFQRGNRKNADEKWKHRGVEPICFDEYNDLWEALRLWRDRAVDFESWATGVLDDAQSGPLDLAGWKLSQVIHLATHPTGAKAIDSHKNPISPKWLFAFDSQFREAENREITGLESQEHYYDPFETLGLEEEEWFETTSLYESQNRTSPRTSWDAFRTSSYDDTKGDNSPISEILCGYNSARARYIPVRLSHLARWITKVSDNPITVYWAIQKRRLHPSLENMIRSKYDEECSEEINQIAFAWEEIFESWKSRTELNRRQLYDLEKRVKESGWTRSRVSQYEKLHKPTLNPNSDKEMEEILFGSFDQSDIGSVVRFDTYYIEKNFDFSEIGGWEVEILTADRRNLDFAIKSLDRKEPYEHMYIEPMLKEDDNMKEEKKIYGISSLAFRYIKRFVQINNSRPDIAMSEFLTWPKDEENIYSRFLIFLIGKGYILNKEQVVSTLIQLPNNVFWGDHHRHDLFHALRSRWAEFDDTDRACIGERIISGDNLFDQKDDSSSVARKAYQSLNMFQWLADNGCEFPSDTYKNFEILKERCPSWTPERAQNADKTMVLEVGIMTKDTDDKILDGLSIPEIADVAQNTPRYDFDNHKENIPFAGLCIRDRWKAFTVLKLKSRTGEYPDVLWREWFGLEWEGQPARTYLPLTTALLCRASTEDLSKIIQDLYSWFSEVSRHYETRRFWLRDWLFRKLFDILESNPRIGESAIVRQPQQDIWWTTEALNAPAGKLVEGLHGYAEVRDLEAGKELPRHWIESVTRLLSLKDDNKRYALVLLMFRYQWFHNRAPKWTKDNLTKFAKSKNKLTVDTFWEGFSNASAYIRDPILFLEVKDFLLAKLSSDMSIGGRVLRGMSAVMLSGWISIYQGKRLISSREFGNVLSMGSDNLRVDILVQIRRWMKKDGKDLDSNMYCDLEEFLMTVWPLEISVISDQTNKHLLNLIFTNPKVIPSFIHVILPRLYRMKDLDLVLYRLRNEILEVAKMYPEYLFEILVRIIPDEVIVSKSHILATLDIIENYKPEIVSDQRFIEMRRGLDSR